MAEQVKQILFQCKIPGRARILKNGKKLVRNPATGRRFMVSSDRYKKWETYAWMFISRSKPDKPIDFPINLSIKFYFSSHQHEPDLSNLYQGVEDILQKTGVITNDKLVHSHDGSRKIFNAPTECVEIVITPL